MKFIVLSVNEDDKTVQIFGEKMFRILKWFLLCFILLSQIRFVGHTAHSSESQAHGFTQQLMRRWHCWLT